MITDRDSEIVALLDDTGGLDAPCLMAIFGLGQTVAYRRLGRLVEHGMVSAARPFSRAPALYLPTHAGLRQVLGRSDLVPPSISSSSYNHQLQVGRVITELEVRGVRWESSRITRRHQHAAREDGDHFRQRRFAVELSWQHRHHLADILMWPSPHALQQDRPVAIEVELTQKTKSRLDEILRGYDLQPDFAGVVYICGGRHAPAAVERAAERARRLSARPIAQTTLETFGTTVMPLSADPWVTRYLTEGPASAIEAYFANAGTRPGGAQLTLLEL